MQGGKNKMKTKENSVNTQKSLKDIELELDLPEFSKKDLDFEFTRNSIVVKANKESDQKINKKNFFKEEKSSKSFFYSVKVPTINPLKVKTDFQDGVLKIVAPRI
ncbi:MAG: hypothetical protein QT05_C0052G0022 [archaeon GW2011_AR13]|nr:MAG: hypothetical protein QT05_C0052G0022 [archaeon GW2011_AR13]